MKKAVPDGEETARDGMRGFGLLRVHKPSVASQRIESGSNLD
jgi:hypothetical protein